eukprot:CAMPEP_0202860610 /NCGR_PEP_ID=MMETSP1391-20130828/2261_1 /ASSEMBLY_ACC=CAM_ASM_000867 /TAXON_ID=1034604 /ORGANISM="Chlamydomonas leiostraca, Strain SAG 11-49" /LENGTH=229 /DNA_ID=CAMNT_0049539815 /DNA_START=110 /DNA_END=799 /DNA_ORIENTATION=-
MAQAQKAPIYDLVLKAKAGEPFKLGDCPFCHRVLLTAAVKKFPVQATLVDFRNKPEWLLQPPPVGSGGKVPVLREPVSGLVMPDSDVIVEHLEKLYPEPSMRSDTPADLGSKLFPAFRGFLFAAAGSEEEAAKRGELEGELRALDAHLAQPGKGPLLGGAHISQSDAAIAPKLYHAKTALAHFKHYSFPSDLKALQKYMDAIAATPEWKATDYGTDAIIAGWTAHLAHH